MYAGSQINSTISTPNARFMTLNIQYFYYDTPMARYDSRHKGFCDD